MEEVFALGSNGSGQLGIGHHEDVSVPKPALFVSGKPANAAFTLRAGGNHTLLLAADGVLACAGDFASGACGPAAVGNIQRPCFNEVQLQQDAARGTITHVAATWESSVVVRRDADHHTKVFTFGVGNKGELGLGELIFRTATAQQIPNFPPAGTEIVDLAAAINHIVAVLNNGDVYGWGNGRKGQLGTPAGIVHSPQRITGIDFKATRAVCGREFTCVFGEPGSGKLTVLGSNRWDIMSSAPQTLPPWKDVGASWGGVFVLTADGKLLSWGRDDHGQRGPAELPPLTAMAVGSEHVVALSVDGDVLSWGWGEHGNCGPSTTNGDVKGSFNIIASSKHLPPNIRIVSIGAGCATSWIGIGS